jgi:LPXTG-motif cell wall-anchored protein
VRLVETVVGALFSLVGLVWLLQGLNLLPGSGMSGQAFWAIVGLVVLVVGLALLYAGIRRHRASPGV